MAISGITYIYIYVCTCMCIDMGMDQYLLIPFLGE